MSFDIGRSHIITLSTLFGRFRIISFGANVIRVTITGDTISRTTELLIKFYEILLPFVIAHIFAGICVIARRKRGRTQSSSNEGNSSALHFHDSRNSRMSATLQIW